MAKKPKSVYQCTACGAQAGKWAGQCSECDAWNTLTEVALVEATTSGSRFVDYGKNPGVQRLKQVSVETLERISSGIKELDRVLGGGLVAGSVILIGGDPGIGKSTLLLQATTALSKQYKCLYTTGEESSQQIALRAQRLEMMDSELELLAANDLSVILNQLQSSKPDVVVVDSIQTLYTQNLQSAPGTVAQVRETAAQLVRYAKQTQTTVILVGHVTKEGSLAGPRVLEHMVDAVLTFEGDRSSSFRLLRAIKNRYGPVNEIGVFAMTEQGLREVTNPSAMFIRRQQPVTAGNVILATQEGTRPLLVEVQALVDQSSLGNPRRLTVGLESSRLAMLLAVIHRHGGYSLADQDVFVNVVGGVRVTEPAADLAICLTVISSLLDRPINEKWVVFGEVGLSGEIRPVQRGQDRVKEAAKLGFTHALIPEANAGKQSTGKIEVRTVKRLSDAVDALLN